MSKSAPKAAGEAVSAETSEQATTETQNEQPSSLAEVAPATRQSVVNLGLSPTLYDKLSLDMRKALHAVEMSWDVLAKPSDIAKRGDVFYLIDALVLDDYIDKRSGEAVSKCVFVLEFEDGHIETVMQTAARPRIALATGVESARLMGAAYKAGPFKFVARRSAGNTTPNDAIIFEKQNGWRQLIG